MLERLLSPLLNQDGALSTATIMWGMALMIGALIVVFMCRPSRHERTRRGH